MFDKIEEQFIQTMEKVINLSCKRLPDDVYARLGELREKEDSPLQRSIYDTYFDNLEKAIRFDRPCCQDTGLPHFYLKAGTGFPCLGMIPRALAEAVRRATVSVPLRPNAVDYFEERNTGDNTGERMPWINWNICSDGSDLEITSYFAGAGCCLPGRAQVFKPSEGYAAIVRMVFDAVSDPGLNACPPLIIGIGLGHNIENAALLSKKAYLRPLGTKHHHPKGAQFEADILEGLNKLGIGAQGLPGNSAVMAVHIESSSRHTATIAAAVNTACYIHRRSVITFHRDMSYEIATHKGAVI
ncbi:tartrate dehydratase subunit alpha [Spirochaetia bacterium]|nr:tartrate dehydratase subunit alpha [Spirochaetia bacterium]